MRLQPPAAWPSVFGPVRDILSGLPPVLLDGFLTAVLVTPGGIPEERWQAELWLNLSDGELDLDATHALMLSCGTHMEALRTRLDASLRAFRFNGSHGHRPAFMTVPGGPTAEMVDTWLEGFWRAARLKQPVWRALSDAEDTRALVMPLDVGLAPDRNGGVSLQNPEIFAMAVELILSSIVRLRSHALGGRMADGRGAGGRPGRNDLCPCGSGQKHKRCCLKG